MAIAGIGGFMIALGLGVTLAWLLLRWLDRHKVYFAPTLTPGARGKDAAATAKAAQQRQVVMFRRYLVPAGLLVASAGLILILLAA
jgi:hypothetical protein